MRYKLQWYVIPVLAAMGRNAPRARDKLTPQLLSSWLREDGICATEGVASIALAAMQRTGYVSVDSAHRYLRGSINEWRVTELGVQAVQAAKDAMPSSPGPDIRMLSTRLWNLLRIRRMLTAEEAAETLVDAEDDFAAQRKRIAALLLDWSRAAPKAVKVAQKRDAGRIRYVLSEDLGRWPPPTREGQLHPSGFAHFHPVPACHRMDKEGATQ